MYTRISFFSLFFSLVVFISPIFSQTLVPSFRVVVDPGHGGIAKDPIAEHGDKYDSITQTYLEKYKQGTEHGKYTEREVVLNLAKEVHDILKLTETDAGWKQF